MDKLRESGLIGAFSNVVTFVYSEWDSTNPKGECRHRCKFDRETNNPDNCLKRCVWLVTDKNTFGRRGEVLLRHIPYRYKFVD